MESSQVYFIKVRNNIIRHGSSKGTATRIIKDRVGRGIYPVEFLVYLKKLSRPKSKARSSFSSNTKLRQLIYKLFNNRCLWCGATRFLEIDHIKPLVSHPHLALEVSNLRLLCKKCHQTRGFR